MGIPQKFQQIDRFIEFDERYNYTDGGQEHWPFRLAATAGMTVTNESIGGGALALKVTNSEDASGSVAYPAGLFIPERAAPIDVDFIWCSNNISKCAMFLGICDDPVPASGIVVENEDGTLNAAASDFAGFMVEGEGSLYPYAVARKGSGTTTVHKIERVQELATWEKRMFGMIINRFGKVEFYVDGELVYELEEAINPALSSGYTWIATIDGRGTATNNYLDLVHYCVPRGGLTPLQPTGATFPSGGRAR